MSELKKAYEAQHGKSFGAGDMIGGILAILEPILLEFIQTQVKSLFEAATAATKEDKAE